MNAKTLLYFILFSSGILIFLWVFQIVFLKYSYQDYQVRNLNRLATSIQNTSFSDLKKNLESIAYENEVCIEYYSALGNTYYYNTMMNGCALGKNNTQILQIEQDFVNSNNTLKAHRLVNEEYEAEAYLYGIKVNEGAVFLYINLEDISSANILIKEQLIYLTIIAIIFAF